MFDRLNENEPGYIAPPTETRLQLAVRCSHEGNDGVFDLDAGTIMIGPISPKGFIGTAASSSMVVASAQGGEPMECKVFGFGYNEDRSGFGGRTETTEPQFKIGWTINVIKVWDQGSDDPEN